MKLSPLDNVIRQLLILTIPLVASPVSSLRCEICSSDEMRDGTALIKIQFPKLNIVPHCGPKAQNLDCPYEAQSGCLTQTKGKHVSKMCSNIPVQDCQVANGVEYCYCRGEMCNKQQQEAPSNQVPKAVTRRPPPAPAPTTIPKIVTTKAPKSSPKTRDSGDNEEKGLHKKDLHQSTTKPESPPSSGAGRPRGCLIASLALLVGRHILTPNAA
ncbi:uncharacterized protein LOC132199882 [Neocloeon triangulifer]|uniref:uncharacterized protein LOC132199882 n=1 Tax=Neocloeon triangulifer TaxID=2078957 RepID=UPI00286FAE15|nr:uncharacterized protein LOC132199882 [Neocloeon triangulifer]